MTNLKLRIERDEDPTSPREWWDNLGTMAGFHKKYTLGDEDKRGLRTEDFSGWDEMEEHLYKHMGAKVVLPLYLYDHSGITMNTEGFGCQWDSGQVGFIFATAHEIREAYKVSRLSKKTLDLATQCLKAQVETYNQYLQGDVWGFIVEDENGEELDSCWGFFGFDEAETAGREAELAL